MKLENISDNLNEARQLAHGLNSSTLRWKNHFQS